MAESLFHSQQTSPTWPNLFIQYQPASQPVSDVSQTEHQNGINNKNTCINTILKKDLCDKQWKTIDKWILIQNAFTEISKCYHCVNLLILIWEKWIWCDESRFFFLFFSFFLFCKWTARKQLCVTTIANKRKDQWNIYRNWYFFCSFFVWCIHR